MADLRPPEQWEIIPDVCKPPGLRCWVAAVRKDREVKGEKEIATQIRGGKDAPGRGSAGAKAPRQGHSRVCRREGREGGAVGMAARRWRGSRGLDGHDDQGGDSLDVHAGGRTGPGQHRGPHVGGMGWGGLLCWTLLSLVPTKARPAVTPTPTSKSGEINSPKSGGQSKAQRSTEASGEWGQWGHHP
jgi:hypothetical protein